jgi:hypothetical protein
VEEGVSESWDDGVGEEVDVEDWWEKLGGRQTEPVRSQVMEESSGDGSGGVLNVEGFVTGKKDLNGIIRLELGGSRAERKKSLDIWKFGPLAIVMAEIVKICKCVKIKSTIFRPLELSI